MKLLGVFSKPEMQPFRRFAAIVLFVCLVDCLVVLFAKKLLPWTEIVSGMVPLLVVVFIVIPMMRAKTGVKSGSKG